MRAIVFSLTLLVSSFLLFLVQPMIGRMLLPSLGGTPAVWNGCVLFFQAILLAGYAWAHYGPPRLGMRNHLFVHLGLLAIVCFLLPMQLVEDWAVPVNSNPMGWLIGQLAICVGLPFFVISSSAPLLQRWFSASGKDGNTDEPWFLYAISNTGSLVALISYPFLFERYMGLTSQGWFWTGGFMLLAIMFICCACYTLRNAGSKLLDRAETQKQAVPLVWKKRLLYIVLAAIPSSLMLGVTTVVSTDVGSFPLMWSIPLALYLLTFVFVFAKRTLISHNLLIRVLPGLLLLMPLIALMDPGQNPIVMISIHFTMFFAVAMVCHGELSRLRPPVNQLTEFYLMMSIGGVLGGAINSLVAPFLFNGILEYPLMLIAACLVLPSRKSLPSNENTEQNTADNSVRWNWESITQIVGIRPILVAVTLGFSWILVESMELPTLARIVIGYGIPAVICLGMVEAPKRFAIGYAMLALACPSIMDIRDVISKQRGFFGVNEVALIEEGKFRVLVNGRTLHGMQRTDQTTDPDPLTYYHEEGPIGDVFRLFGSEKTKIAAVGLGVGSLAAYATADQEFDFFEIDPVVCQIANDQRYFTYLSSAANKGADIEIILGDARIQLDSIRKNFTAPKTESPFRSVAHRDSNKYELMVMDAFGSDAVPLHLITSEAVQLYLDLLEEDGLLVFHVSSKFIDFSPIGAGIAEHFGLASAIRVDRPTGDQVKETGRNPSIYMVMSRDQKLIDSFFSSGTGWQEIKAERKLLWTDEHANVLDVMKW
ncbi:MAG: hypothetical protein AB8B55_24105 [Mariniblastus sp.]